MLEILKSILESLNTGYTISYNESSMMNIVADGYTSDTSFAYIEEFRQGKYSFDKYQINDKPQIEIYFGKFIEHGSTAEQREAKRSLIESEIVVPFIKSLRNQSTFKVSGDVSYEKSIPRFDANEVSILLRFETVKAIC